MCKGLCKPGGKLLIKYENKNLLKVMIWNGIAMRTWIAVLIHPLHTAHGAGTVAPKADLQNFNLIATIY